MLPSVVTAFCPVMNSAPVLHGYSLTHYFLQEPSGQPHPLLLPPAWWYFLQDRPGTPRGPPAW